MAQAGGPARSAMWILASYGYYVRRKCSFVGISRASALMCILLLLIVSMRKEAFVARLEHL